MERKSLRTSRLGRMRSAAKSRHRTIAVQLRSAAKPSTETKMLSWALTFLIVALIAGVLGFTGIAGTAASIAKILFLVFLVLFIVSLIVGRKSV